MEKLKWIAIGVLGILILVNIRAITLIVLCTAFLVIIFFLVWLTASKLFVAIWETISELCVDVWEKLFSVEGQKKRGKLREKNREKRQARIRLVQEKSAKKSEIEKKKWETIRYKRNLWK